MEATGSWERRATEAMEPGGLGRAETFHPARTLLEGGEYQVGDVM